MITNLFSLSDTYSPNYVAKVIALDQFITHPSAKNLKGWLVNNQPVWLTKDYAKKGDLMVYFPLESQIDKDLLGELNLFKDSTLNADSSKTGFFEHTGRVKALKIRQQPSYGFLVKLDDVLAVTLNELQLEKYHLEMADNAKQLKKEWNGLEFDCIVNTEICTKYVPRTRDKPVKPAPERTIRTTDSNSLLLPDQFRFHFNTPFLGSRINELGPNSFITITQKLHGTSVILSNLLCDRKLSWFEKLLDNLDLARISNVRYKKMYASRRKVLNDYDNQYLGAQNDNVYGSVFEEYKSVLTPGISIYGEVLGYTPAGNHIAEPYTYGMKPFECVFVVYRITMTSPDGLVVEYSWEQVKAFCEANRLLTVPELYSGLVKDLFPELKINADWAANFGVALCDKYLEYELADGLPDEGICIRQDIAGICNIYKMKSFKFLEWESKQLDKEVVDLETAASTI